MYLFLNEPYTHFCVFLKGFLSHCADVSRRANESVIPKPKAPILGRQEVPWNEWITENCL